MSKYTSTLEPEPATLLRAALRHARMGWHVFPIRPGSRRARLSERTTGRKWGASSDPAIVERMFARYPLDDIGIVTGALSGIWVLDVDNKNGKDGRAALEVLITKNTPLGWTATAETPNGGEHHYFRHPGRHVHNSTSRLAPGLDVRGDGGVVVAPPTRGRRWITSHAAIAPAPSWLVDLVCEERSTRPPRTPSPLRQAIPPPELLAMWRRDAGRGVSADPTDGVIPDDVDLKVWCALQVIPADCDYDTWWRVGCAIYAALGDEGFGHFREWSSEAPNKYPGEPAITFKWRECAKASSIREDTLYWIANQYDRAWRDAYRVMLTKESAL